MAVHANGHADPARQSLINNINEHIPSLRSFGISLSGNPDRADDLVQETIYRAISNIHLFEVDSNLSAWLFTILRNLFRSEYRKRKREVEWDPAYENLSRFSIEMNQDSSIEFSQVAQYIACLRPAHRDAIMAIGYLGLSYEEAAYRLGCEMGTIKSRTNRARSQLIEWIESAKVEHVDVTDLQSASKGMLPTNPYYPIAKAYEAMFAEVESVGKMAKPRQESESDKLWAELVASGALEAHDEYTSQQCYKEED